MADAVEPFGAQLAVYDGRLHVADSLDAVRWTPSVAETDPTRTNYPALRSALVVWSGGSRHDRIGACDANRNPNDPELPLTLPPS